MGKTSFAVKLDKALQKDVKEFCDERGLKQGAFVEKALREQMERNELAEDILDLYTLGSSEPKAINLDDYLKRRKNEFGGSYDEIHLYDIGFFDRQTQCQML